jgi:hypothetical protein
VLLFHFWTSAIAGSKMELREFSALSSVNDDLNLLGGQA